MTCMHIQKVKEKYDDDDSTNRGHNKKWKLLKELLEHSGVTKYNNWKEKFA